MKIRQTDCRLDKGFKDTESISNLLTNTQIGLDRTPSGLKENMYFIVDNSRNIHKRAKTKAKHCETIVEFGAEWHLKDT